MEGNTWDLITFMAAVIAALFYGRLTWQRCREAGRGPGYTLMFVLVRGVLVYMAVLVIATMISACATRTWD
jgi:hypothetical protein